jgi:DHA3 family tetracycline resistance protein-like MFS transporter
MTVFRSLAHRPFALLWSGQTVSRLGDGLYSIALAWWVLEKTGSAAAMGVVLICSTIPMILFLLVGGVVVDRLPRVRLMLASDLLRGALVALIAFLAFQNWLELWQLFVLSALFGVVRAFFYPAYTAIIPDLVPAELLPSANSLRSISLQVAQIIGPGIGAAIVAFGGTPLAFALDGVSFAISAGCLVALPKTLAARPSAPAASSALQDARQGISAVLASPWLWITIAIASLSTIFLDAPDGAAMPLLVKQHFGAQVGVYALFTTLAAIGSIGAALWLGHFKRLRRRGLLTYGAWLLAGLMIVAIGLLTSVAGVSVAVFIQGAAVTTLGLAWMSTLQEFVPSDLLGRVSSIDMLVSSALVPIGYGIAGIAADRLGAAPVFILGGAIGATIIALGLLHPAIRAVD